MILAALAAAAVAAPGAVTREAPMPNLYSQPSYCRQVVEKEVARQQAYFKVQGVRMGQYAVLREIGGCSVPTPVGYHPDAAPPAEPATREDAPSNRR